MASRSEGETCDERAVLCDVLCSQVAPQWRDLLRSALTDQPTWMPYLLLYMNPVDQGAYFLLSPPSSWDIRCYKKTHQARVVALDVFARLARHVEQSAAAAAEWEDRWPMDDGGSADWLA